MTDNYEVGDLVETPLGPGVIMRELGRDEHGTYFSLIMSDVAQKAHGLSNRPYKMNSASFTGIIQKDIFD